MFNYSNKCYAESTNYMCRSLVANGNKEVVVRYLIKRIKKTPNKYREEKKWLSHFSNIAGIQEAILVISAKIHFRISI